MSKRKTKEQFIEDAKQAHGDKYDYSLVDYINSRTKVKIICPIHGLFEQVPTDHLRNGGCKKCGLKKMSFTKEQFIEKAKQIHGDKYDYFLVDYKNNKTKVKIICHVHGVFEQTPTDHLGGHGCYDCSLKENALKRRYTTDTFIKKAKEIHGDLFDYSQTNYIDSYTKVKIICPKHGEFWQKPGCHIIQKHGCPMCNQSRGERTIAKFLKENGINFVPQKTFEDLKDKKKLTYDFCIESKKILIEYNGLQHYEPIKHFGGRKYFLIQKHHDWLKRKYALKNEYFLLTISYMDDIIKVLKNNFKIFKEG